MRVAVLGGSGFVGEQVCRLLLDSGHQVVIGDPVESPSYKEYWIPCDIQSEEDLARCLEGCDCVLNLAAVHRDDVSPTSLYYDINVEGQRKILNVMDALQIRRLVFTSSVAVYGMNHESPPAEGTEPNPFNHYGKSKLEAEEVINEWASLGEDRGVVIVRPTVIFGPGNRGNVFNLLSQIHSGKFLMIGSGENRKSMAYVGNVAGFLNHVVGGESKGVEVYNYVDKPDMTMNDLVGRVYGFSGKSGPKIRIPYAIGIMAGYLFDAVAWLTRKKLPISSVRVKKFCSSTVFLADKVPGTGFTQPFKLEDSLVKTLEYEFNSGRN